MPIVISNRELAVDVKVPDFVNQGTISCSMVNIATLQLMNRNDEPPGGKLKINTTHGASKDMEKHLHSRIECGIHTSSLEISCKCCCFKEQLRWSDLVRNHFNIETGPLSINHPIEHLGISCYLGDFLSGGTRSCVDYRALSDLKVKDA